MQSERGDRSSITLPTSCVEANERTFSANEWRTRRNKLTTTLRRFVLGAASNDAKHSWKTRQTDNDVTGQWRHWTMTSPDNDVTGQWRHWTMTSPDNDVMRICVIVITGVKLNCTFEYYLMTNKRERALWECKPPPTPDPLNSNRDSLL